MIMSSGNKEIKSPKGPDSYRDRGHFCYGRNTSLKREIDISEFIIRQKNFFYKREIISNNEHYLTKISLKQYLMKNMFMAKKQ
jgi:hypothetical protein